MATARAVCIVFLLLAAVVSERDAERVLDAVQAAHAFVSERDVERVLDAVPAAPADSDVERRRKRITHQMSCELCRHEDEEMVYNAQMLSSAGDKKRLLQPLLTQRLAANAHLSIVDVGPAGGAIVKSIAEIVDDAGKAGRNKILYIGIELNDRQYLNMTQFLTNTAYPNGKNLIGGRVPKDIINTCQMIEGNALHLGDVLASRGDLGETLIVQSSVIHEIFSFSPVPYDPILDMSGLVFAMGQRTMGRLSQRYNPQTVYKNYEAALLQLHKVGGHLAVRDGVLYSNPDELVSFTIHEWGMMHLFLHFIADEKYHAAVEAAQGEGFTASLQATYSGQTDTDEFFDHVFTNFPAKLVQEFMLKANWGSKGWQQEIREVYCYATLSTHVDIVQRIEKSHGIRLHIHIAEEYSQQAYKDNLAGKLTISDGFERSGGFPPTNMLLKLTVDKGD